MEHAAITGRRDFLANLAALGAAGLTFLRVMPDFAGGPRTMRTPAFPSWALRAGMWLYDMLAAFRNVHRHRMLGPRAAERWRDGLRREGLHHGLLPLLDVILEQPDGERFIMLALRTTDERIERDKPVSPAFLFAALLWP